MANRPVFVADQTKLVRIADINVDFSNGFAKSQKQKNINKLHEGYKAFHTGAQLLDISRYSTNELGVALSAFNLTLKTKNGDEVLVEQAYQAGKVFQHGGPYLDLLDAVPADAKRDLRLQSSGKIIGFEFDGMKFPTQPMSLFYTWLYLKGLENHPDLSDQLVSFDAFTDIVFNSNKSMNCQAAAAAVYVALRRRGDLAQAMGDIEYLAMVLSHKTADKPSSSADPGSQTATMPAQKPEKTDPFHEFAVNDEITHPTFGSGTITHIEKSGSNVYLQVTFPNEKEVKEFPLAWVLQRCQY